MGTLVKVRQYATKNELLMRLFLSVNFPEHMIPELNRQIEKLRKVSRNIRWTKPENIHLTLKFLGDIPDENVSSIVAVLRSDAVSVQQFKVSVKGIGFFPNAKRPRIIWAGVDEGAKELSSLAKEIEEKMIKAGIGKEKWPFTPHATIGRVRIGRKVKLDMQQSFEVSSFDVKSFKLMKSVLTSSGPEYEVIESFIVEGG